MSPVARVNDAGLREQEFTIDGSSIRLPAMFQISPTRRQFISTTLIGTHRIDVPYDGAGMPDQPDVYSWSLGYELDDNFKSEIAFLEALRAQSGVHLFTYWKKTILYYTNGGGQQLFYLPRTDAYSQGYSGKAGSDYKAVVKLNGGALTVSYQLSVDSGSAVPSGDVWISNTPELHPESGRTVAAFKIGTVNPSNPITVEYVPLFRVGISDVATEQFTERTVGREDKTLYLVEVS